MNIYFRMKNKKLVCTIDMYKKSFNFNIPFLYLKDTDYLVNFNRKLRFKKEPVSSTHNSYAIPFLLIKPLWRI